MLPFRFPLVGAVYDGTISDLIGAVIARTYRKSSDLIRAPLPFRFPL